MLVSICPLLTGCSDKEEASPEVTPLPEPGERGSGWGPSTHETREAYKRKDDSTEQSTENVIITETGADETRGDYDGDGEITTSDALCALKMAVGKQTEDLVLDVNGDGRISSIDARKILRNALGLEALE